MNDELTPIGRERRETILRDAQTFARSRRRRRSAGRLFAAAAVTLCAGIGIWPLVRPLSNQNPVERPVAVVEPPRPALPNKYASRPAPAHPGKSPRSVEIVHILTDMTLPDRLRAPVAAPVTRLDDDALLAALAAAGKPAAIVSQAGRVTLVALN